MENARITVTYCLAVCLSKYYVEELCLHFKEENLGYETTGEKFEQQQKWYRDSSEQAKHHTRLYDKFMFWML
jgi:hypothetical protein